MNISTPQKRLLAAVLDSLISAFISLIVLFIVGIPFAFSSFVENASDQVFIIASLSYAVYAFIFFNSALIIQMFFWAKGESVGKHILKMKVVEKDSQVPLNFWKMAFREIIGKYISGLFFSLGFLWIIIDSKNHQAWHDKILNTVVIDSNQEIIDLIEVN